MTKHRGTGNGWMVLCVVATVAMCVVSFMLHPERGVSRELGICLPSPDLWDINPVSSWMINTVLLGAIAAAGFFLNRKYNFIRSTKPVLTSLFLVLAASNPWITWHLSSSTLLCAVNVLCVSVLFGAYDSRNATQEMFVIGTFLSVGSMFQYAFLPMIPAYIAAAVAMKSFRVKEFLAMGMGLVAPYWVGIGLGLLPLDGFRVPHITNLVDDYAHATDILLLMLSAGLAIFFGLILGLNNSIKLYAGNSRVNAMNLTISFVGVVCSVCVIIDFSNMTAYLATLYFTVAAQVANLCALWNLKHEWLAVGIISVIYIGFFIAMVL